MKKICVFGSSSEKINRVFLDTAEELGRELAERGYTVVFGGGKYGVMGAASRGVISKGGGLIGVSPDFFVDANVLVRDYGELILTETMRERKARMEDLSDAFVVCAGGTGTLEELFEVLTLKQLGRHSKPIIFLNTLGFYDPVFGMMEQMEAQSFISAEVRGLYSVAHSVEEVFEQLDNYVPVSYSKYG